MPVIKADQSTTYSRDAVVLDLGDLTRQGQQIIAAANARAEQILTEARQQAAQLAAQAKVQALEEGQREGLAKGVEQGHQQGHAEALAAAQAQLETIQQSWTAAIGDWTELRGVLERDARQAVLSFAAEFTKKAVHRVIETDASIVIDQVTEALALVLRPLDIVVRINPEDRAILEEALPAIVSRFANVKHVELVEDDSISRGGCITAYGQGQTDSTIEIRMQRLVEAVMPNHADADDTAAEPSPVESETDDTPPTEA